MNNKKKRVVIYSVLSTILVSACALFCVLTYKQPKASVDTSQNESVLNNAYSNGLNINLDNKDVQKVLSYYEESNLDVSFDDKKTITYTVDSEVKDVVEKVEIVLCLKKYDNDSGLYVMGKECDYNTTTGVATFDTGYESLLINNEQPVGIYNDNYDNYEDSYIMMAFLDDEENPSKIAITKDENNKITVRGVYNEKEKNPIDANVKDNLNKTAIKEIPNGTRIYPAYDSYKDMKASINDSRICASEVYKDNYYIYGNDFNLSYGVLPDGEYIVSMKIVINSSKDKNSSSENNDNDCNNICIYTNQKAIKLIEGKTDSIYTINEKETSIDGYKEISDITEYYKYVMKCNKNLSQEDKGNLYAYLGSMASFSINRWLRTGKYSGRGAGPESYIPIVETINKKCNENMLDNNILLFRNIGEDFLTNAFDVELSKYDNNEEKDPFEVDNNSIIKNLTKSEADELLGTLKNTCINKSYVEKAILSTSMMKNENVFRNKPIHLVIKAKKGTHAFVTDNICESEVIFKTNTKLEFTNVELQYDENRENTRYVLYCNVIE